MSKLIRDNNDSHSDSSASEAALLLPLSPTVVVKYLKACQNLTRDHIQKAFDHYVHSLLEAIDIEIDRARSNQDATEFMEVQRRIKKGAADLKHYFCGYYLEGFVKFSKKRLHTSIGSEEIQTEDELSIVENEDLEETIAISSITQRADTYFAEPIWALNQRFAILNNGEPVTESNNPVSPIQFCDALRRALKFVELNTRSKTLAYKVFDYQLINLYRLVVEDVNQYLKEQGVLPNLKFSLPKGRVPESYLHEDKDKFGRRAEDQGIQRGEEPNPEAPPEQYQQELVQAIRGLQHQLKNVGAVSVAPAAGSIGVPVSSEQLVNAIQLMQQHNVDLPQLVATDTQTVAPLDIGAIVESLKAELKEQVGEDSAVEKQDMQTIDLVGMVFEYMLDDENIPDTVKAVLSYLHTPFLKIAFVDPGFFERAEHPARVLLNTLADAGAKWVGNDGSSQFDMLNKIKSVVNKVIKDFDSDIKIITGLLFEFSTYVKTVSRKQELTEKRAKEKAEGEDKLREVKIDVNDAVRSRTRDKELPSAILLLLLQPWSDYLTFILLRHGKESEAWQSGIKVVDDVIWCIQPKESIGDREKLESTVEDVIARLRKGFEVIGFDANKSEKLVEAFESMTDLAKQSQKVEPAPEPMRNELERIAAERAGQNAEAEEEVTPEELQMVESLKMIEFGTWFEFDGGKRLKVAWYNGRTSHYMLVDQMGKRVDMVSGLILARQMIAGQAKIISGSSKPFFERALENIYQKLNEKAEAMPELQNASN
jgi:hypothetical protein